MPVVLGVDSSTQSTTVELRDAESGALLGTGRAPHPPVHPPRAEQDPAAWWEALTIATGAALAAAESARGRRPPVAALAVAGQQHGLVVTDADGTPLRPAKLWNDTESAPEAGELVGRIGPAAWAARCGSVPVASMTVTKVAWLARHEPDHLAATHHLLLPHDWLTFRLTGRAVTDRGDASGTCYWSPASGEWQPDLLDLATDDRPAARPWTDVLPQVLGPTEPAGPITPAAAAALGLVDGPALVAAGTGDNMAGALGIGLATGDVAVSLGTSGTVYAVAAEPTADATGAVAGFADASGGYLPLVCTLNATQVTDVVARLLGVGLEELDVLALSAPAGAGGLVLLPYLSGERTPNRPDATGVLAGLRTDAGRPELARAAVEGVVCGLLDGLDALGAAGVDTGGRLVLLGGGSRSPAYRRVVADLTGRVVSVPPEAEQVALGACVQAAAALHGRRPQEIRSAWDLGAGTTTDPEPTVDGAAVRAAYAAVRG